MGHRVTYKVSRTASSILSELFYDIVASAYHLYLIVPGLRHWHVYYLYAFGPVFSQLTLSITIFIVASVYCIRVQRKIHQIHFKPSKRKEFVALKAVYVINCYIIIKKMMLAWAIHSTRAQVNWIFPPHIQVHHQAANHHCYGHLVDTRTHQSLLLQWIVENIDWAV